MNDFRIKIAFLKTLNTIRQVTKLIGFIFQLTKYKKLVKQYIGVNGKSKQVGGEKFIVKNKILKFTINLNLKIYWKIPK